MGEGWKLAILAGAAVLVAVGLHAARLLREFMRDQAQRSRKLEMILWRIDQKLDSLATGRPPPEGRPKPPSDSPARRGTGSG